MNTQNILENLEIQNNFINFFSQNDMKADYCSDQSSCRKKGMFSLRHASISTREEFDLSTDLESINQNTINMDKATPLTQLMGDDVQELNTND